jgi:acetolactate synthase-1/2/3 large subunit
MKLSDYIAEFLFREGVRHVFVISGGAIVHCIDSVSRHPEMQVICTQHEQGAGAAADGYSRISQNLGAAMVTSGPGATNLTTSIANAYFDSIPVIFICGQVATFRIKRSARLRQKGFQETDVVSLFSSITKYAKQIQNATEIKYELQKAVYLAGRGRLFWTCRMICSAKRSHLSSFRSFFRRIWGHRRILIKTLKNYSR